MNKIFLLLAASMLIPELASANAAAMSAGAAAARWHRREANLEYARQTLSPAAKAEIENACGAVTAEAQAARERLDKTAREHPATGSLFNGAPLKQASEERTRFLILADHAQYAWVSVSEPEGAIGAAREAGVLPPEDDAKKAVLNACLNDQYGKAAALLEEWAAVYLDDDDNARIDAVFRAFGG
jgi:hypothetical protein